MTPSAYDRLHFVHRCWRYRWRTERQQLRFVRQLALKGQTVLDVGANRGIYTYWLSRWVGHMGQVHAFEPQPELAREICGHKVWLSMDNVHVHSLALSDKEGTANLTRTHVGDGSAAIEDRPASQDSEVVAVATDTLDNIVARRAIGRIAFLKCDVEGHELKVFHGAVNTLCEHKPVLLFETRVHDETCARVLDLIMNLGYHGHMLLDGEEVAIANYKTAPSRDFGLIGHRDFVFRPDTGLNRE